MNDSDADKADLLSSADDAIGAKTHLLQMVLDSLTHPFYVIDADDHRIRLANRAALDMYRGGSATCYALTHDRDAPCDGPCHPCPLQIAKKTREPAVVEHVHCDAQGKRHDVEVHAFPIFDGRGQVVQVIEYCVDITEHKQADDRIRTLNEQLERRVLERTAELTEANRQLCAEMEQRRRLETEIMEISEREQRRIGQELHDSLGQQLTGIAIMSKILQQRLQKEAPDEAARAGEIAQLISQAIDETRRLSRGLGPVAPDETGLMTALQGLAAATQRTAGVVCSFQCDEPVPVRNSSTAVHLYRIAQEAVSNAIRHGRAKRIRIRLHADRDRAILSIENDGRAFPKRLPKNRGLGLQVMTYRAEGIGGILDVQRGAAGGTRVTCVFASEPQQREEEHNDAAKDAAQH